MLNISETYIFCIGACYELEQKFCFCKTCKRRERETNNNNNNNKIRDHFAVFNFTVSLLTVEQDQDCPELWSNRLEEKRRVGQLLGGRRSAKVVAHGPSRMAKGPYSCSIGAECVSQSPQVTQLGLGLDWQVEGESFFSHYLSLVIWKGW